MKHHARSLLSAFLIFILLLGRLQGALHAEETTAIPAGSLQKNDKTRHVVCTELSAQAQAYYPAGSTYEDLILLDGKKTTDSTVAIGSPLFNRLQSMMQLTNTVSYKELVGYYKYTDANNSSSTFWFFYDDALGTDSYSREHVWPKKNGNFYQDGPGSDLHHLRPTDSTTNSTRSDYTLGDVQNKNISKKTKEYDGRIVLWYSSSYSGNDCSGLVEVMDSVKGDVARILLYVYVTYGNADTNKNLFTKCGQYGGSGDDGNAGEKVIESLDTLLRWNALDPVDEWEMRRNDLCQDVQGNRNIFIDYPELAWYLFDLEDEMPDMETPSGNAHGGSGGNYRIEAISSDTEKGTVSLDGQVITAYPKEGCRTAGYEIVEGSAEVTQNGDVFYITPHSDCKIKILFEEKIKVTLTYMVNGALYDTQQVYQEDAVTLPSAISAPEGWTFAGWVTTSIERTDEKPKTVYTTSFTPSADTTLYALFTQSETGGGEGEWTKLTSPDQLSQGTRIVFSALPKNKNLALAGEITSGSDWLSSVDCPSDAVSGNKILNLPAEALIFIIGGQSGAWTFTSSKGVLGTTSAKKVNLSGSGTKTWTIAVEAGNAIVASTSSTCGNLQYNATYPRFTTYTSNQTPIQIYYLTEGDTIYYSTEPDPHVYELPVITKEPANIQIAEGQEATFSITAEGEEMSFQWFRSMDGGATFTAVSEASGKTAAYRFTAAASLNGSKYYCEVTNPAGTVRSKTVTLTIVTQPAILKQPKSAKTALRKMVSFSVTASGGGLSYQWYMSSDGGKTFSKINEVSARTSKYCLKITKNAYNGCLYYCEVKNQAGTVTSEVVKLTVIGIGISGGLD